ncbi:unnamed protein product [Symbiodinium natans]|uniref:Uncharacterized protein n=1 Tax=Symbiodinium natans TaxID=878477 RepID=A0A812GSI6_9DINO|nr:unnamed protein product [Symbiodinium natans]
MICVRQCCVRPLGRPLLRMLPRQSQQPTASWFAPSWDGGDAGQWGYASGYVQEAGPCWDPYASAAPAMWGQPEDPAMWQTKDQQTMQMPAIPDFSVHHAGGSSMRPGQEMPQPMQPPMMKWATGGHTAREGRAQLPVPSLRAPTHGIQGTAAGDAGRRRVSGHVSSADWARNEEAARKAARVKSHEAFHRKMRNIQLNKDLLACDSSDGVLKICDENLDDFNQVNVVTALHRIAKHHKGGCGRDWQEQGPRNSGSNARGSRG